MAICVVLSLMAYEVFILRAPFNVNRNFPGRASSVETSDSSIPSTVRLSPRKLDTSIQTDINFVKQNLESLDKQERQQQHPHQPHEQSNEESDSNSNRNSASEQSSNNERTEKEASKHHSEIPADADTDSDSSKAKASTDDIPVIAQRNRIRGRRPFKPKGSEHAADSQVPPASALNIAVPNNKFSQPVDAEQSGSDSTSSKAADEEGTSSNEKQRDSSTSSRDRSDSSGENESEFGDAVPPMKPLVNADVKTGGDGSGGNEGSKSERDNKESVSVKSESKNEESNKENSNENVDSDKQQKLSSSSLDGDGTSSNAQQQTLNASNTGSEPGAGENFWQWFQESKGGSENGSAGINCPEEETRRLCSQVYKYVKKYKIRSIYDVSCSKNTKWMPAVLQKAGGELWGLKYICSVPPITPKNTVSIKELSQVKEELKEIKFAEYTDDLWWKTGFKSDKPIELLFAWDVLPHIAYGRVWNFFVKAKSNKVKYILIDNYPQIQNDPSPNRQYINVRRHPFKFPPAKELVQNVTEPGDKEKRQLLFYETDGLPNNIQ